MYIEMLLIIVVIFFILIYNNKVSTKDFFNDNRQIFNLLKEKDYEFLLKAKFGEQVIDVEAVFMKRIKQGIIVMAACMFLFVSNLSILYLLISVGIGFLAFKWDYIKLKSYYNKHLNNINSLLPYYLKSLEVLVQHYTVPVALSRSIDDAPEVFKDGLREMVDKIEAGDSSIDPYMEFAQRYPVRDSIRMMRLLYRLGLGEQEKKHQQLESFSKSVSNLQNKAREQKYKSRLDKMESKTMVMLVCTGVGTMVLLLISMVMMLGSSL